MLNLFKRKNNIIEELFTPKKIKREYYIEVGNVPFYVYVESKGVHNISLGKLLEEQVDKLFRNI